MFERRELVRNLTIPAKHLQRNIHSSFLSQIKADVEGRCSVEGYIQPRSSVVLDSSLGTLDILKSGVRYRVRFQADVCLPHKGQILTVPVTFKSKIGISAEKSPLRILLPRDLHIGNPEFETIEEGNEIEIEVLGCEFKQGDEHIFVLGKLIKKTTVATPSVEMPVPTETPASAPPQVEQETTKSVVFSPPAPTASAEEKPARRKRRLGTPATVQINVGPAPSIEGESGSA